MAGRGGFNAITTGEIDRLLAESYAVRPYMAHEMPVAFRAYMDKAWVTIHRALSDNTLYGTLGEPPLCNAILGDELIGENDRESFLYLKRPHEVIDIAAALARLTRENFEERLDAMDDVDDEMRSLGFGSINTGMEHVWPYVEAMREFYQRAADEGLAVLFGWG
jgi:hypothetical protein